MADVVIVGGGVVGSAVAYYLTKAGAGVTLVERDGLAAGASGAAAAWASAWVTSPGLTWRASGE